MNKKWILLVILLAAVLVGSSLLYRFLGETMDGQNFAEVMTTAQEPHPEPDQAAETSETTEASEPNPAPDFTVYDADGNAIELSSFRGKPVIINFWATWCGFCVEEMPDFEAVFQTYGDEIHVLMVNATDGVQETKETAAAFVGERGFTFPVYYDTDQSAVSAFGINSMPMTFFLDAEGNFVAYGQGMLSAETLQKGVELLLS